MLPAHLAAVSQTASCLLLLVLAGYFYRPWRNGVYSFWFIGASVSTAFWAFTLTGNTVAQTTVSQLLFALHYACWIGGLISTRLVTAEHADIGQAKNFIFPMLAVLVAVAGIFSPYSMINGKDHQSISTIQTWSGLLLGLLGCFTVFVLLRKTMSLIGRASIFLGLGCLALFAFDVVLFSEAIMFNSVDSAIASWRPVTHCLAAILLLFATMSMPRNKALNISRHMMFFIAGTSLTILFLLTFATLSYFATAFGVERGKSLAIALLLTVSLGLLFLFVSRRWRANLSVWFNKHFFMHKYDYRSEWLKLINILSQPSAVKDPKAIALQAAMEVFHTDQADLWLLNDNQFNHVAGTDEPFFALPSIGAGSHLCKVLESEWVLHPYGRRPESRRNNTALPSWMLQIDAIWVVAPLIAQQKLVGFFILRREEGSAVLSWEDLDVLKTVGRQLGSYLALQNAAQQLSQSEQFDTYNKLTAFIMHDLKNLIAQQALVVENAKKHKENPAFVEDAIKTIENSVGRMSNLLGKMQQRGPESTRNLILDEILLESVNKCRDKRPVPSLRLKDESIKVAGDHDHLVMIFSHVIKNAQEATAANGFVDVFVDLSDQQAVIRVEDNGQGMSKEFIEQRLFKPFDTTKSGQGMGIGVFQTREYIRSLGGDVNVHSVEGIGSTFSISLPTVKELDNVE